MPPPWLVWSSESLQLLQFHFFWGVLTTVYWPEQVVPTLLRRCHGVTDQCGSRSYWTMLEVILRQFLNPCSLFRLFLCKRYIGVTLTPLLLSEVLSLLLTFSKRSIQKTNFWKRSAEPVFMQVISRKSLLKQNTHWLESQVILKQFPIQTNWSLNWTLQLLLQNQPCHWGTSGEHEVRWFFSVYEHSGKFADEL